MASSVFGQVLESQKGLSLGVKPLKKSKRQDFSTLEDEIVLHFLGYLKDPRDLCMASQVCPSWKRCAQDEKLWESMTYLFGIEGEFIFWRTFVKLPN